MLVVEGAVEIRVLRRQWGNCEVEREGFEPSVPDKEYARLATPLRSANNWFLTRPVEIQKDLRGCKRLRQNY
jgi:hypothetical protein